ncbi:MAG: hypothetical protein QNJ68_06320 [Microcoleaceae cyanobacterium MO_207.B10]|nr:hypothetical protein [Microcoleaceae cyanobacterium MO_207.B10]
MNGMIAVDALTGEEYFQLKQNSKTEDVSDYFLQLCLDCGKNGCDKFTIILDKNSTDKTHIPQFSIYLYICLHYQNLLKDKMYLQKLRSPIFLA